MSERVSIGKRFTIVIPKPLRKKLNFKEGQRLLVRLEAGRLLIEPLPADPYGSLERLIGEPYNEERDEKRVEEWLKKRASH